MFDLGDQIETTGKWSPDHCWLEIIGGETGTVWVNIKYISQTKKDFLVYDEDYRTVKIRKHPIDGRVCGYVKRGQTIVITQVILGWGRCSKGWVDLGYFNEVLE